MHFSGKITNSLISCLEKSGKDYGSLYELTDIPTEFLRDPSCWIPATSVENFIQKIEQEFTSTTPGVENSLVTTAGSQCYQLRAWGVLDSVLKMMQNPQDIYLQPHRFISYFISPAPPVIHMTREEEGLTFELPISNTEFPLVTEYLRSALETLPMYLGRQQSHVSWRGNRVCISWSDSQNGLLSQEDLEHQYKPELMRNIVGSLEEAQKKIEELNRELLERNEQIQKYQEAEAVMKQQSNPSAQSISSELLPSETVTHLRAYASRIRGQLLKLSDYVARSQQLVTILVGQSPENRQVKELMKRLDWDYVRSQHAHVTQDVVNLLEDFEGSVKKATPAQRIVPIPRELMRNQTTLEL